MNNKTPAQTRASQARPRNKRSWVSINLVGAFIGMLITGIVSYILAYSEPVAGIHTWFGFTFIALMVFHLRNNFKTLLNYLRQQQGKKLLSITVAGSLAITLGVVFFVPPFSSVLEFGQDLRKSVSLQEGSYQTLTTHIGKDGLAINIELRRGEHYESAPQPLFLGLTYTTVPQVAFWVEDLEGHYIDTLYVTKKSTNASFVPTEDIFGTTSRPEALPYWSHQRGVKYDNNLMVPGVGNTDLDGMTGPTPLGNYDIHSNTSTRLRQFKVMMEINRSYDFNKFYSKDKFPDDPIYSGSGSSGQPSVIYSATVDLDAPKRAFFMEAVGHGHHSGADGLLYTDMQGIDTALQLVKRVIVDI